jgi:hypothetical protein
VGGRGRPQGDSTEGERTQSFPCIIRCETVRFRLQKYRNGGQLWVVNVFSYTIHAQTDSSLSCFPLALSIFVPLLLWRLLSSQLFCVHYTGVSSNLACSVLSVPLLPNLLRISLRLWFMTAVKSCVTEHAMLRCISKRKCNVHHIESTKHRVHIDRTTYSLNQCFSNRGPRTTADYFIVQKRFIFTADSLLGNRLTNHANTTRRHDGKWQNHYHSSSSSSSSVALQTLAASHQRFRNLIKTLGRTPLDEWSAHRRGLYLHRTT